MRVRRKWIGETGSIGTLERQQMHFHAARGNDWEPQLMSVKYEDKGSILNPVKTLSFFTRKPVTEPLGPREAAPNYRGFHVNDWETCIGCSTCQKVCDNAAITMVRIPDLPHDEVLGVRNERPAIDYGRCCWCGLCVDICPTGSLALTREYVHTCLESELDSYFILPDPNGMHKVHFEKGWAKGADNDLVDLNQQPMAEMATQQRLQSFDEMVEGYTDQQAIIEASRCVQCGMCHDSCPTHMNAPEYIRAIWEGKIEDAIEQIYRSNPFSHICGRVCTRRCETACSVGRRGDPVSIRWLKRYAMDQLDHDSIKRIAHKNRVDTPSGKTVAIVGAGPAGLTAAWDLAMQGHAVTVLEALPGAGGMTRYGIPAYRLPYQRIDDDVDVIASLGVEIRYNTRIGSDLSMADLQRDYDAVVLAIGLHRSRSTRIPGSDHAQVRGAIDLLRMIRLEEGKPFPEPFDVPRSAVIIGGGNTAMDIARSLARLQLNAHGSSNIILTALEQLDKFLADPVEIREAGEEGVTILDARGPKQVVIEGGELKGLKTLGVVSIFDENGRFAPKYDEADRSAG
jgi:glutamate synthase (NADPH/NADH) small chain